MKFRLLIATFGLLLAISSPATRAAGAEREITQSSVKSHLEFLASDAMNGRGSGTRDEWIAAEYIASHLRRWGLEPLGDNGGYVQVVEVERPQLSVPPILRFGAGRFTHGAEVIVEAMSAPKHAGPLQKFQPGVDVKPGAVVLLPDGTTLASVASLLTGAAAVMLPAPSQTAAQWKAAASRPVALGARLVAAPEATLARPARVVLDKGAYASISALKEGTTIAIEGQPAAPQKSFTWNAVGQLKGRDASQTRQVILLSAHLDHIGNRPARGGSPSHQDTINNGADDDASGCVAVLELARVMAADKRPKRTIIFAFFGSEEAGGFGSRYFAERPPVPLRQIVANLQFEMIGRPDAAVPIKTLWLTGYERSNLGAALAEHGARLVQDPHPQQNFFFRSDNIQFARRGIVAHTVSSYGLHKEYHTPEDETRLVDYAHMTEAIRSMVKPIRWLANSKFAPAWLPGKKP